MKKYAIWLRKGIKKDLPVFLKNGEVLNMKGY
jgi:hypothetical protein